MSVPDHLHDLLVDDRLRASGRTTPEDVADAVAAWERWRQDSQAARALAVHEDHVPHVPAGTPVELVLDGGAGAVGPAVEWAARSGAAVRGVELAVRGGPELAHNARRLATVAASVDHAGPWVASLPAPDGRGPDATWLAALDELAATETHLSLAAGGDPAGIVAAVDAALDREVALVWRGPAALVPVVLHATRALLDGAEHADVVRLLATPDPDAARRHLAEDPARAARTRRWCPAYRTGAPEEAAALLDL